MSISRIENISLCLVGVLLAGCAISSQITNTSRSSIEQRLLVRALERAMVRLDIQKLKEKTVAVDFYGLTPDKDFAKEYFTAWLQSQGVGVAPALKQPQLRLKVFASVLAVDQGQSFFGSPSFTVPVVGFGVPEIPLFKNIEHSGHAELKISMTDGETGEFLGDTGPAVGRAEHHDYTILIVIHFTRSDLEEQNWNLGPD
jgi:hypothetical protein